MVLKTLTDEEVLEENEALADMIVDALTDAKLLEDDKEISKLATEIILEEIAVRQTIIAARNESK